MIPDPTTVLPPDSPAAGSLERGRLLRKATSRRSHASWQPASDRDPVAEAEARRAAGAKSSTGIDISLDDARRRDHLAALGKLSVPDPDGNGWLIRDRPPLLQRLTDDDPRRTGVSAVFQAYLRTLLPDRRLLVEKHRLLDVALKVVGVGSVGTYCYIALLRGPAGGPLILQVKQARASVLAPYVKHRGIRHEGERVVTGQRIMQAVSDSFLGWTRAAQTGRDSYVRQLHDMKYSLDTATFKAPGMEVYARVCAWALARAHARSGDPALIAGYLGQSAGFDDALAAFAVTYADQTERDHAALTAAIRAGKVAAEHGV